MLSKTCPETELRNVEAIGPTEILESINDSPITTLDEMREAIATVGSMSNAIELRMKSGAVIMLNFKENNEQDAEVHRKFGIKPDAFSLKLWG